MGASSVTGSGHGVSDKRTTKELAILANGPTILESGIAPSVEVSVGVYNGTVVLSNPLPGKTTNPGAEYCVFLTTMNGSWATIIDMDDHDLDSDNEDDHFVGFTFATEDECDVMYMVCRMGIRPSV